jgi:threonylcarbamoyladenosine tRNA methylthiotransferase MtaB
VPGFHVENFGCRSARADGEAVSDRLRAAGLCERQPSEADVVVVNTCSVTAEADREARAYIRRAHRVNPEARIVVTGCYAQRAPGELAALAGVSAVVGNSHKALAPQIAHRLAEGRDSDSDANLGVIDPTILPIQSLLSNQPTHAPIFVDDRFAHSFLEDAHLVPGPQTRPNLKIQEGCGNRCTFCVIPQTRGSSRSLSAEAVLRQVAGFVTAGGNELVLSGINLGRWGRDLPHDAGPPSFGASCETVGTATPSLAALVRRIFAETDLPRLRLSSIEPMDWNDEMIALTAEFGGTRLSRHAHLPLQSGSDAVLRRMHRRYRPWHYAEKVAALIRAAGPELTLGADVMVGFPGETDFEFEETLELVRALPFGYLHLFPFSPRPGTRAWALHAASPVSLVIVDERMAALRILAGEKTRIHREQFVGRTLDAITLHTQESLASRGRTQALTENYLPVEIDGALPANRLVHLRVTGMNAVRTLEATVETDRADQYAATAMSVSAKSVPLNSSSSPLSLASA